VKNIQINRAEPAADSNGSGRTTVVESESEQD
jgi:hypothetical protein